MSMPHIFVVCKINIVNITDIISNILPLLNIIIFISLHNDTVSPIGIRVFKVKFFHDCEYWNQDILDNDNALSRTHLPVLSRKR
jgi:hypothetical protein